MQDGDRVFDDAEWALYETGLDLLRDFIEDDIDSRSDTLQTGIAAFDHLTAEQKLTLLAETAKALRDSAVPTPHHTAANEGTIAAVFSMIRSQLELELALDGTERTTIRRMILAMCACDDDNEEPLPNESSPKLDEWAWLLEAFEERVFWDADFDMGDEFLDLPPEEARKQMQLLGISPDYYLAVPEEPDQARLDAARSTLGNLLNLKYPRL